MAHLSPPEVLTKLDIPPLLCENVNKSLHLIGMRLCNRLREIRLQKNLTQASLSAAVGVTRQTIIAIEKGKFGPSVRLALLLASTLDIPVERLFWLENDPGGQS
jgi:putative transcriptional regulator